MLIGEYCRKYRTDKGVTLKELGGDEQVKNLSAFEFGRSSNIAHFIKYVELATLMDEEQEFMVGFLETVNRVD